MKTRVIIRADGGTSMGMGHVVRSLALADMLKTAFQIHFAIQQPTIVLQEMIHAVASEIIQLPATSDFKADAFHFTSNIAASDIVVLDGYHFDRAYQETIKKTGCKIVCIDDLHAWHFVADAIINHAVDVDRAVYSAESYTKFYLGPDYILLRKEFFHLKSYDKKIKKTGKIFISMGAADTTNLTLKFAEALVELREINELHLMLGSINPHLSKIDEFIKNNNKIRIIKHIDISATRLIEVLDSCDACICPASSIALESCAIGIPIISGYSADNQLGNLLGMEKRKILFNLGDLNKLSSIQFKKQFSALIGNNELINEMISQQRKTIDGRSPERILNLFNQLTNR